MIGHIKIERKILNWEWYTDHKVLHFFIYLLLKANHKDSKWRGIPVKRGQLITGRLKASSDTGLTEREIRTCISKLKSTKEIVVETTKQFSIITVCKYEYYQTKKETLDQQIDQQNDEEMTNERPTSDQRATTNKNDNNDNNEKKKVFNNKPSAENFNGLPQNRIDMACELIFRTQKIRVSDDDIKGLWEVFKVQNLTGENWYANEGKVYSHFLDKIKFQKFTDGKPGKQTVADRQESGFDYALERGKRKFNAIGNKDT